ncbi:MAG: carbonic anhydrase [Gemmatimonadota bacterium]
MPRHLIEGLRRFRSETFPRYRDHYRRLVAEGQQPSTLFIGCADSRVLPDLITDTAPGELFLVRNVGAFVPPFEPDGAFHGTAAGIEFAVLNLEVTDIVVCGHSHCGAVRALYDPPDPGSPHLARWLELGRDARVGDEPTEPVLRRAEQRSIALQLGRLMSYPFVAERVEAGTLSLHGWHYIIEDGQVLALDLESESFVPVIDGPGT